MGVAFRCEGGEGEKMLHHPELDVVSHRKTSRTFLQEHAVNFCNSEAVF